MTDHLVFRPERAFLICSVCLNFSNEPHLIGLVKFCAAHCPVCNPVAPAERTGAVSDLAGEQGGLF